MNDNQTPLAQYTTAQAQEALLAALKQPTVAELTKELRRVNRYAQQLQEAIIELFAQGTTPEDDDNPQGPLTGWVAPRH